MDINYFDLVAGSIILLLGLKGILNGFFKELFGLIGIVGGVFVASRFSEEVGGYLSDIIFHFDNSAAVNFTGFLVVLAVFWTAMITVGFLLKKLSAMSGLGIVDRILGFVFGASKFFFIVSIIAYAVYNVKTIRQNIEKPLSNSILFPIMVKTGGFIMKMDPVDAVEQVKEHQEELQDKLQEQLNEHIKSEVEENTKKIEQNTQELQEKVEKSLNETASEE